METVDYIKKFESVCDYHDREFILLCDMRIAESDSKIKLYEMENKHWHEIKKIFLEKGNNDTSSTK